MTDRAAERGDEERWALLPVMLAALGLATGVVIHLILGTDYGAELSAVRVALLSFVSVGAILFGFIVVRGDVRRSAAVALGAGLVAGLILYFNGSTAGWGASEGWRLFSLALAIGIAAPLFQAGRAHGFRPLDYPAVHDHVWTNAVLWCLGWAFTLIVWLMAWLLASLFQLIGIELLRDLLQMEWFHRPLFGLAFGLGLALLREHERIVRLLRNVGMLVLGVLAPVLAMGLGLFLLALPFTGLQPLWDATKATTPILLTCAAGAFLLVNAVIGNGVEAARHRVLRGAGLVLAVVILPLTAIAAIATGLRIDQYGFTPERLWALTFVILATIYGVAYLVSIVRGRRDWAFRVRSANLVLAMITCGVALLLATPLLSFNAISTRDQVARLEAGKVAPDKFDWRALAFQFGEPGRRALERLKQSSNAAIRAKAVEAGKAKSPYELERVAPENAFTGELVVSPKGAALPPELAREIDRSVCTNGRVCRLFIQPDGRTAVVVSDGCATVSGGDKRCMMSPVVFVQGTDGWARMTNTPVIVVSDKRGEAKRDAVNAGQIEVRKVERRQLFIGGEPQGQAFE